MRGLAVVPKLLWTPVRGVVRTVSLIPRALEAVLVLPTVGERLERVEQNTDALNAMLEELRGVHGDTAWLPHVHKELAAMRLTLNDIEENTLAVERLAEVALPLQGAAARVGRFADRLPQRRVANGR